MAKWRYDLAGSSSHIHASLWDTAGKKPLFLDPKAEHGMSALMRQFRRRAARLCAGDHLVPRALHQFLQALPGRHLRADQGDLVARQPHRRLPALRRRHQGDPHRMPHRRRRSQSLSRVRGADCRRASPASSRSLTLEPASCRRRLSGQELARGAEDAARGDGVDGIIQDAAAAFGDEVIDHYVHTAEWEQFEYDRRITDWELKRGFERY